MEKILIYPYSNNYKWALAESISFNKFDSAIGIYPDKWQSNITDDPRIKNDSFFFEELEASQCFWIVSSDLNLDFKESILPKVEWAAKHEKKIFCTRDLSSEELSILKEIVQKKQWISCSNNVYFEGYQKEIFDIDIPTVAILNVSEELSSIKQLLTLRDSFTHEGYEVAVFSNERDLTLLDNCYWLSMFCENRNMNQIECIISANHYIKKIEMEKKYDLILISITQGTALLSRKIIEDFGINVYSMTKAIRPDSVLLNIPYGEYEKKDLRDIVTETEKIIGDCVDYINMSNKMIDFDASKSSHHICTKIVDNESVLDSVRRTDDCKLYCLTINDEVDKITKSIIDRLSEYSEIVRM